MHRVSLLFSIGLPQSSIAFLEKDNPYSARRYSLSRSPVIPVIQLENLISTPFLAFMYEKRQQIPIVDINLLSAPSDSRRQVLETFISYAKILGVQQLLSKEFSTLDLYQGSSMEDKNPLLPSIFGHESRNLTTLNPYTTAAIPLSSLVLIGAIVLVIFRPVKPEDGHILSQSLLNFDVAQRLEKESFRIVRRMQENTRGGVNVLEVLALAGWFMFTVSGSFLEVERVDFELSFAVFGASSCILAVILTFLERSRATPAIFIVATFATLLSLIGSGYTIANPRSRLMLTGACIFVSGKVTSAGLQMFRYSKSNQSVISLTTMWALAAVGYLLIIIGYGRFLGDFPKESLSYVYACLAGVGGVSLIVSLAAIYVNYQWLNGVSAFFVLASIIFAGGVISDGTTAANTYHFKLCASGAIVYLISISCYFAAVFYQFETPEQFRVRVEIQLRSMIDRHIQSQRTNSELEAGADLFDELFQRKFIFASVSDGDTIWLIWRLVALSLLLSWALLIGGIGAFDEETISEPQLLYAVATAVCSLAFLMTHTAAVIKSSRALFAVSTFFLLAALVVNGILLIVLQELIRGNTSPSSIFTFSGACGVCFLSITLWSISKYHVVIPDYKNRTYNTLIHQLAWLPWIMMAIGI